MQMSFPPNLDTNCLICQLPLFEAEVRLQRSWHFDCEKCQICGEEGLAPEQIAKCLADSQPVAHTICLKTKLFADFKNNVVPITKSHIDALNAEINSFYPQVNPNPEDVQLLFALLTSLQETATNVSHALNLTKDKLLIRESRNYDHQVKQKQAEIRQAKLETQIEKLEREKRSEQLKAERENPMLRNRRKAIEGLMAIGYSKDEAEAEMRRQELEVAKKKEETKQ